MVNDLFGFFYIYLFAYLLFQTHIKISLYFRLLPNQNTQVQKLALHCILAWRAPGLVPYRDHLENLIPENKYRDTLALFGYAGEDAVIKPAHTKVVVDMMIKLLWPKISTLKEVCLYFLIIKMDY
jgi:U3 small nucleolar RNA-associated protein 20